MVKTFAAYKFNSTEAFPAALFGGVLVDLRTGEPATADHWEEISNEEFDTLCDAWGIEE